MSGFILTWDCPISVSVLILLILWEITWKAIALYKAGKKQQPIWFIALLLLNTLGILPIIYLLISKNEKKAKKRNK